MPVNRRFRDRRPGERSNPSEATGVPTRAFSPVFFKHRSVINFKPSFTRSRTPLETNFARFSSPSRYLPTCSSLRRTLSGLCYRRPNWPLEGPIRDDYSHIKEERRGRHLATAQRVGLESEFLAVASGRLLGSVLPAASHFHSSFPFISIVRISTHKLPLIAIVVGAIHSVLPH